MLGFVVGLVAAGAAIWMWRGKSPEFRDKVADQLGRLEETAEGAMDTAKDRIRSGLRAGQDYLRTGRPGPGQGPSDPLP